MPLKVSGARLARFEHGNPRDDAPRLRFSARTAFAVTDPDVRRARTPSRFSSFPPTFRLPSSEILPVHSLLQKRREPPGPRTGGHQPREQVQRLCAEVAGWG